MAIDRSKIIFNDNISPPPGAVHMLNAVPVWLYRVEVSDFRGQLNFFQKYVLRLKLLELPTESIAFNLGINAILVHQILHELQQGRQSYLDADGLLTELGRKVALNPDAFEPENSTKVKGYVIRYVGSEKYYPHFLTGRLPFAEIKDSNQGRPKVDNAGNGYVHFLDHLWEKDKEASNPDSREIARLIYNGRGKSAASLINHAAEINKVSIKFLEEAPEKVWLASWIYLEKKDDDHYAPDWDVLDPFGFGVNPDLKYYLKNPRNKILLETLDKLFGGRRTIQNRDIRDYNAEMTEKVKEKLAIYGQKFELLDPNLQIYCNEIESTYLNATFAGYISYRDSTYLSLTIQKAMEGIFEKDKQMRPSFYRRAEQYRQRLGGDSYQILNDVKKVLVHNFANAILPENFFKVLKGDLTRNCSLRAHLAGFILTLKEDVRTPLLPSLQERVAWVDSVAAFRNPESHGKLASREAVKSLTEKQFQHHYKTFREFLMEYLKHNYE